MYYYIKRTFDFVMALIALLFLIVPLIVIALLVKVTSKGSVLYWSDRVGINKVMNISFGVDTYSVERLVGSFSIDTSLICKSLNWYPPISVDNGLRMTFLAGEKILKK
jgi:hypothetical protein